MCSIFLRISLTYDLKCGNIHHAKRHRKQRKQENNKDVSAIRTGDIGDVVAYADANFTKDASGKIISSDLTGVYVMTVDNDTDTTPLATSILVVVPYVK